nr:hypothetical protein [Tanacetum cinerariifolium]
MHGGGAAIEEKNRNEKKHDFNNIRKASAVYYMRHPTLGARTQGNRIAKRSCSAKLMVKSEQARAETMRELEKISADADIKRSAFDGLTSHFEPHRHDTAVVTTSALNFEVRIKAITVDFLADVGSCFQAVQ